MLQLVIRCSNKIVLKAGVKAYDKIVEIEGKKLEGMTTEEATAKLRGPKGTKVKIKVLRENKKAPLSFEITRDIIKAQSSFAFYIKEYDVYYVSLTTFSSSAVKQIKKILEQSTKKPYKGLIIDLRNNSGGLLSSVIDISGLFLDKGSLVVTTKDKNNKKKVEYKTTQTPVANINIPIFILTNNYTASAAEILAGCLKIHSQNLAKKSKNKQQKKLMVFTVGTKTFGKGSVQEVIPISNNSAIKLTSSLYFLPNNKTIQGQGIEPDFVVEKLFPPPEKVTWFLRHYGREKALKHSIKPGKSDKGNKPDKKNLDKNKNKKDKTSKSWTERIKEMLQKDNQFKEALKLINIFDLAKKKFPKKILNREEATKFLKDISALNGEISMQEVKI
ncbi:S41 family peptidase [Candidatus Dependentiae bacterium]